MLIGLAEFPEIPMIRMFFLFLYALVLLGRRRQINYINVLDNLYEKTRTILSDSVNSPKFDAIMETLFKQPILTFKALSERLSVSVGQAKRYLEVLEKKHVLFESDRRRNKLYCFLELLEAMRLF